MKNLIFLVIFELFAQDVFCNDNLLSKFHQNAFKIKDFRVELMSYNENYFDHLELKTFKYNRTTSAVNATGYVKANFKENVEVLAQAYKFLSNEYRHFPVRFQVNLRKAFDANAIGIAAIRNCGNLSEFDFKKGKTYHCCNFVIDETHFPPLIPSGRYKINLKILYLNDEIAFLSGFGEVYTPTVYPIDKNSSHKWF